MKRFIAGIFIGLGIVIPGVSGAVLAILFGIYDKVIYILNHFFDNLIKNIIYLLPICLGALISVYIFGNILIMFINNYENIFKVLFIGVILGGIPFLLGNIKKCKKTGFKISYFIISLLFSLLLIYLDNYSSYKISNSSLNYNYILLIAAGFLYISGKIIPGISSAFFLIIFGIYNYILSLFINPFNHCIEEYIKLIPFFLGIIIGFIVLIKLIDICLNKYFCETYSSIIGFICGSTLAMIPDDICINNLFLYIVLFIFSFFVMCLSTIKLKKYDKF